MEKVRITTIRVSTNLIWPFWHLDTAGGYFRSWIGMYCTTVTPAMRWYTLVTTPLIGGSYRIRAVPQGRQNRKSIARLGSLGFHSTRRPSPHEWQKADHAVRSRNLGLNPFSKRSEVAQRLQRNTALLGPRPKAKKHFTE
jgi:hypothetical protein